MKFLLLIRWDESKALSPAEAAKMESDTIAWVSEVDGRRVRLMGERLEGAASAKSVRVRGGKLAVHDGPFAETKEQIVGFDLIDCASIDEVIEVASKHPVAGVGLVEVRPFWEG